MAVLTYDENGDVFDFLSARNDAIKANLKPAFQILLDERDGDRKGNKRLGNRMRQQINKELNKQPLMTAQEFLRLDGQDIRYYWNSYYDLICYYTLYFEIVPNRQEFIKYMGINSRQYEQLQEHEDEEIRAAIIFVEDSLKQEGFSAGENGSADAKAIATRLSAKRDGHSVVSAGEEMLAEKVAQVATPLELQRRFESIKGLLGGAK
jgi:hypothetical protein